MANYAVKACNRCGIRKPQPEMERVEKSVVSGSSKSRITSGNVLGALAGSKLSQNKIKRNVFANNKRQYTRKRTVWNCFECSGRNDRIRENRAANEAKAAKAAAKEAKAAAKGTVADQGVQQQKVGGGKWILRMLAYFWIGICCAATLSNFGDGGADFFATIMAGGILAIPGILILKFVK